MKRAWTRNEKWLWATPLLLGLVGAGITFGPEVVRHAMGWPESLKTTPGTYIRSMALSANGEVLAAGGTIDAKNVKVQWVRGSGTVYLWNARTAKPLPSIAPVYARDSRGFTGGFDIYGLKLSPNAKQIGFTRVGQNWMLYDVAAQTQLWQFSDSVSDAEFSRDGRFIALSNPISIAVVRASDGHVRAQWKHSAATNSPDVDWSPDGKWIASIGSYNANNPIELNRADNGKLVRRIQSPADTSAGLVGRKELIGSVAFSPDSRRLVVAASLSSYSSNDNFDSFAPIRCYDSKTGKLVWKVMGSDIGLTTGSALAFCDAIFSPDGRVVAAYQYNEGQVLLLDAATGTIKATYGIGRAEHSGLFVPPGLAFSPDGKRLFARGGNAILFWDLQ